MEKIINHGPELAWIIAYYSILGFLISRLISLAIIISQPIYLIGRPIANKVKIYVGSFKLKPTFARIMKRFKSYIGDLASELRPSIAGWIIIFSVGQIIFAACDEVLTEKETTDIYNKTQAVITPPRQTMEEETYDWDNSTRTTLYETPYEEKIKMVAIENNYNHNLLKALCIAESNCQNPNKISPEGAEGLMQIMPKTGTTYCGENFNAFNPEENLECGGNYFGRLLKKYGDVQLAIAAYNCCKNRDIDQRLNEEGATFEAIWPNLPMETKNHITRVLRIYGDLEKNDGKKP